MNSYDEQINALQQQLAQQSNALSALLAEKQAKEQHATLHQEVEALVPPHLQLDPLEEDQRKKILRSFPKPDPAKFPKAVTDNDGIATKHATADVKRFVTKDLVTAQRNCLDVARALSITLNKLVLARENGHGGPVVEEITRDISNVLMLNFDNAHKLAERQLQMCFEACDAKGALAMLNRSRSKPNDLEPTDNFIFQQAHVDVITEFKTFQREISKNGGRGSGGGQYGGQNRGRGRGGFNRRRGRGRGGYSNSRGQGSQGNRGNGGDRSNRSD